MILTIPVCTPQQQADEDGTVWITGTMDLGIDIDEDELYDSDDDSDNDAVYDSDDSDFDSRS